MRPQGVTRVGGHVVRDEERCGRGLLKMTDCMTLEMGLLSV
jgi:hypothetical protein